MNRLILSCALFLVVLVGAHVIVRGICGAIGADGTDCPTYWPLSVFYPRLPEVSHLLTAVVVIGLFVAAVKRFSQRRYPLWGVLLAGIVLVLGSNLIQGWERAFAVPIAGEPLYWTVSRDGHEYYHDALRIGEPFAFVADYEARQPELFLHSRSHPPGAVLTLWLLYRIFHDPAWIGIAIACLAVAISGASLYGILRAEFGDLPFAGYGTFLFLLLPATQIYFAASLDALICAVFLLTVYLFLYVPGLRGMGLTIATLFAASWLTFGVVFLVPVLAAGTVMKQFPAWRPMLVLCGVVAAYGVVYALLGFNYVGSFGIAAALENPDGFRLLENPAIYALTRLEDVSEILIFLGPFLLLLLIQGLRSAFRIRPLVIVALGTLMAMFAAGAFRTGETARACLFIYPYLLLPALFALHDATERQQKRLFTLVFGQTMLMQLFDVYFW